MGATDASSCLRTADVSFAVAIMPESDFARSLSRASLAIPDRFENRNIIDEQRYPAHLSLYLAGVSRARLEALSEALERVVSTSTSVGGTATRLYSGRRGFLGVRCDVRGSIRTLHDEVVHACADIHRALPTYRPHLVARWAQLSDVNRRLLAEYGSYKVFDRFDAHFSVAQVAPNVVVEAERIARRFLTLPHRFGLRSVQLVDIGHENERWTVLREWPLPPAHDAAS